MAVYRLGVDIGGTFTDIIILAPDGTIYSKKVLSTPDDYSRAIEDGVVQLLDETGISADEITEFAHGTTVATNALIERRGVKVALITTRGFRDVLELGRFRSPRLYDLEFRKPDPLVERRLRFEVDERTNGKGEILVPVDTKDLDRLAEQLVEEEVQAVAICFINSYVNPENELNAQRWLEKRLPAIPISASAQLLPQIQEYERTSTTVVNAYIRPVVESYVTSLVERMGRIGLGVPLTIMQSSGGVLPAALAAANPVYIIESGPAAGVVGAQRMGGLFGLRDLIVLDMGGTTAKASLIQDGKFTIVPEAEVGGGEAVGHRLLQGAGYPIQVPTIDIAEVGAGGGSIATVDAAGGFQVGPRSAGAMPGPVCYAQGGDQPTVTDANLVLGYLNPGALVGGNLSLDEAGARTTLADLGARISRSDTDTAYGVHLIANANMMRALSSVSSERGLDPSGFTMIAIGGSGGAHAAGLAESLGMRRILVPPAAGLFSALGLLFADVKHHLARAYYRPMADTTPADFNAAVQPLVDEGHRLLDSEGFTDVARREVKVEVSMKYMGQTWTLPIPCRAFPADESQMAALGDAFVAAHHQQYGYRSDNEALQLVALGVIGRGIPATSRLPDRVARSQEWIAESGERDAFFGPDHGWLATKVMPRSGLGKDATEGPLIVEEYDTTVVVRPGWRASLDSWNNIVVERT
jgi:N-methylhydantoinase A